MNRDGGPVTVAVIRAAPDKKDLVRYPNVTDRLGSWRYYSVVNALRMHGAQKIEAEETAKWAARSAKPGEKREIWPGIEIVIVEDGNAD